MKKIKEFSLGKTAVNLISSLALVFAIVGANTRCLCIFHDPDKPDLSSLKKHD